MFVAAYILSTEDINVNLLTYTNTIQVLLCTLKFTLKFTLNKSILPYCNNLIVTQKMLDANCEKNGASEDFAEYLLRKPGAFFFLGAKYTDPKNPTKKYFHHSPNFKINPKSFVVGVQMFVNIVFDIFGKG